VNRHRTYHMPIAITAIVIRGHGWSFQRLSPSTGIMCNTSVFSILRSSCTSGKYTVRIQVLDFISLLTPPFLIHCRTCISFTTAATFAVLVFWYLILSHASTGPELNQVQVAIHRITRKNIILRLPCVNEFACHMPRDALSDTFVLFQYMRMP
jgi:hypothetical protein